jgi:hypothetical protein
METCSDFFVTLKSANFSSPKIVSSSRKLCVSWTERAASGFQKNEQINEKTSFTH